MNSTSPASRCVSNPARSPALSMVGPLAFLRFAPIALAMILASVVLPSPGGPLNRMWSIASPRCRAAWTVISSRSLTLAWRVNSEQSDGRSVISSAASGLINTSEIIRSDIVRRMRKETRSRKGKDQNALPRQSERGRLANPGRRRACLACCRKYLLTMLSGTKGAILLPLLWGGEGRGEEARLILHQLRCKERLATQHKREGAEFSN